MSSFDDWMSGEDLSCADATARESEEEDVISTSSIELEGECLLQSVRDWEVSVGRTSSLSTGLGD